MVGARFEIKRVWSVLSSLQLLSLEGVLKKDYHKRGGLSLRDGKND